MLRYAITPGELLSSAGLEVDRLVARCGELAADGVEFLLLREKKLGVGDIEGLSRRVVERVRGSGMRVVVPGRADVALASGAHGVHLSASALEFRVAQVREVFPKAWVSVSCHTEDEVRRASREGADAVLYAPVFGKVVGGVEVSPGVGRERLSEACAAAGNVPLFALGGITRANAGECMRAGAAGVAGIRMFFGEDNERFDL